MLTNDQTQLQRFTTADKWLFTAHLLTATGAFCFTISTLLRISHEGRLIDGPIQQGGAWTTTKPPESYRAKDYFS